MPETVGQIGSARPHGSLGHAKHLRTGRRGPGSAEYEFDVVNSLEYDTVFYDFRAATMPVDQIGAAGLFTYVESDNGSTPFVKLTPTIARPSDIIGIVDNSNPSSISLQTLVQFDSAKNPFVEFCFEVSVVTNLELVLGFIDVIPAASGDILGDIDTPTLVGTTEAVVMGLDTAQTLVTGALVGENAGTVTKADFSPVAAPFGIPTLATKVVWRLELRGDSAFAFVNGALVAELPVGGSAATGTLLAAVFQVGARSAAAKNIHVDYIYLGQERTDLVV